MKSTITLALAMLVAFTMSGQAVITAVFDGPLPGGTPKGVEIYITQDIADLSIVGVASANNGTGSPGAPEYLLSGSATAGQYLYVASDTDMFNAFFGFAPDFVDGVANINGDDAIELYINGNVADVFGEVDVDGTGMPWEYLDGWAARLPNTGPDGSTFVAGNWTYSGPDALDGATDNATADNPVPLKSYTGGTVTADVFVKVRNFEFDPRVVVVDPGTIVQWDNEGGFHNVNGQQSTFPDNTEDFYSGAASNDNWSYQYTFNNSGYNTYQCDPHAGQNMTGGVMVRETGDVYVSVENNVFVPEDITIEIGQTVVWTNVSGNHNVNGTQASNPESFGNGAAAQNWTYKHTFSVPGNYDYQCDPHVGLGMTGTVTVVSAYPSRTMATVKQTDADGVALYRDSLASLTGQVYGSFRSGTGVEFFLINENNQGVYARATQDVNGYMPANGDQVTVSGRITQFRGLIQIVPEVIQVQSSGNADIPAEVVSKPTEGTESSFIRINDLSLVDASQWPDQGSSRNVLAINQDQDTVLIRFDGDIDLMGQTAPTGLFDIVGCGGQFNNPNSAPFDNGYQILPRSGADILDESGTVNVSEVGVSDVYPNPTTGWLTIESAVDMQEATIITLQGRTVAKHALTGVEAAIDLSSLSAGMYILQVRTDDGIGATTIVKK